jgi:predicted transcriptional regulator
VKAMIARELGFGESTVRAILNKASMYKEQSKFVFASFSMECCRKYLGI